MESQTLDNLFSQYSQERDHSLSKQQFAALLKLVPALMVASSDGLDSREKSLVNKLTKMMGDELIPDDVEGVLDKEEVLMKNLQEELNYILKNISRLRPQIIAALKDQLAEDEKSKDFVSEAMYLFAGASSGFSKEEEKTIDDITEELGINDQ